MSLTGSVLRVHERIYELTDGRLGHGMIGVPSLLLRTMGRRSGAIRTNGLVYARDGDRYLPIGPALILVVGRPHLGHQSPQARPFVPLGIASTDGNPLVLDLDRRVRVAGDVLVPVRVVGRTAPRGHHHPAVVVLTEDQ